MIKAVDIRAELAALPFLRGRGKETPEAEAKAAFATLAPFRDGSIFAGSFSGQSLWERHRNGDELVQILDGAATLTIMTADGALAPIPRSGSRRGVDRNPAADRSHLRRGSENNRVIRREEAQRARFGRRRPAAVRGAERVDGARAVCSGRPFNAARNASTGRVLRTSSRVAQPRRAWSMPYISG